MNIPGLTNEAALEQQKIWGFNEIVSIQRFANLKRFLKQFKNPLVYVLIILGIITLLLNEIIDTLAIAAVTIIEVIAGYIQETKAENALSALKKLVKPKAKVIRLGVMKEIPAREIVPGDILSLDTGDIVPADGIIVYSKNLQVTESQLTGESYPVDKTAIPQEHMLQLNRIYEDKSHPVKQEIAKISGLMSELTQKFKTPNNQLFQGTFVTTGKGLMVATQTGKNTEVGKISTIVLKQVKNPAPIETRIVKLTKVIFISVILVCLIILILGLLKGFSSIEIFRTTISLGVSAIPEGLPIIVTLTLAIGVWKMGKANAILKNLASASTLAGVTIICTDKTGTLTEGHLIHSDIYTLNELVSGEKQPLNTDNANEKNAMVLSILCNNAVISSKDSYLGDPLDQALLYNARRFGLDPEQLQLEHERLDEIPFDSSYKYQATLNTFADSRKLIVKGAPEILLEKCNFDDESGKNLVQAQVEKINRSGLRTIIIAEKTFAGNELTHKDIAGLKFIALLEFIDPMRKEVPAAISACKQAKIKVIMITGDHLATAKYLAEISGIFNPATDLALTGAELEQMNQQDLIRNLNRVTVIARANPKAKMRIINAYQQHRRIVAMTGDGVNDAPALTTADIGISMGKIGTDVAREASDMVLTDDNFATIIKGIEQARLVYENLRKVILFLFSTAIVEVLTIILSLLAGLPLPLVAVQILWLNLLTDGPLDVALATEKKEGDLMLHAPGRYTGQLLTSRHYLRILFLGVVMTFGSVLVYIYLLENFSIPVARTAILLVLALYQWFNVYNVKSEVQSVWKSGIFNNKAINYSIIAVLVLQILAIYYPAFQVILQTTPLPMEMWILAFMVGFTIIIAEELRKFFAQKLAVKT